MEWGDAAIGATGAIALLPDDRELVCGTRNGGVVEKVSTDREVRPTGAIGCGGQ